MDLYMEVYFNQYSSYFATPAYCVIAKQKMCVPRTMQCSL
jgi:hypothetical protein